MENTADIYLDYAAATPMAPEALQAMLPYLTDCFYNPSAPYARARETKAAYENVRETLAHLMGARPAAITITTGATEANNLAFAAAQGEVVVSAIEHASVMACAAARDGRIVGVTPEGFVRLDELAAAITPETGLVSIALANGEIGCIQPMREIAALVHAECNRRLEAGEPRPIYLHTDASQAAAHLSVNVSSLGADLITVSAAKMGGPKQVGLLWAADNVALQPIMLGGGQEAGLRSGTENVAGVVAFATAFELACRHRKEDNRRLASLRDQLQRTLTARIPGAVVSGPRKSAKRLPNILHISFPGIQARRLVVMLENMGVSVGTGSACAASKMQTSPVLQAIGLAPEVAEGSLRISLGTPTTRAEIERAGELIAQAVEAEYARCKGGAT